jgi:hypothetical protein
VAAKLRTTGFTVGLWRNRLIAEGIAGLGDEPRPGAPREIGDDKVEQVRLTLEKTPKGATHWSSRMLAAKTGLSQSVKGGLKVDQGGGVKGSHFWVCEGCWGLRGEGLWSVAKEALAPASGFWVGLGVGNPFAAALFEAGAVAVHLEDVDVVG